MKFPGWSPKCPQLLPFLLGAVGVLLGQSASADTTKETTSAPATASSPAPTPAPEPKSQAYTDGGTTTHTVDTYRSDFGSSTRYSGSGFSSSRVTIYHRPIYFPPEPPPLGEPNFPTRSGAPARAFGPPTALAGYLYEPFYAPLSTLLFAEDLSRKRRERLDAYRANRAALLAELRARVEKTRESDPASRERELASLATEQAGRLATLETEAEELRENFAASGPGSSSGHDRRWRLGDDTRWESHLDEIQVIRGTAAYQEGLVPAQRRLLREIAMELSDGLKSPTIEIALDTPGPFLYFSPATARIRIPAEISAELADKIEEYKNEKAVLKQELRDTLYVQDRAWFNFKRVAALKALADHQAARFVVVERLAEEIRRGLAPLPNPARPPALPLPATLAPRVAEYQRKKLALQTALLAKLDEVRSALPQDRVEFTRQSDTYLISVIPNRRSSSAQAEKRGPVAESLAAFNHTHSRLYSELAREKEVLRREFTRAAGTMSAGNAQKSIDGLLKEYSYAFQQQEAWERYRDYETAVLEPGLSPAQRDVLFGAALEKLDLPLAN